MRVAIVALLSLTACGSQLQVSKEEEPKARVATQTEHSEPIQFTTYRVYAQSPFDENTDRVEWAPCKPDSVIINGGCDCGGTVATHTYQVYNAQFCKCGSWTYRMSAYAVCMKGPGLGSPDYMIDQIQEADRLNIGGVTGNGSQNQMNAGAILFTPWDYQYH